jgi:Lanthionine synthetase C-like protein
VFETPTMSQPQEPPAPVPSTHRPRHFRNDQELKKRDPYKQLVASLTRLVKDYPPKTVPPGGGIYYGPVSIAYLFFVLQRMYSDLEIGGYPLETWAAQYLKHAQSHMKEYPGPSLSRCGVSDDIMTMLAIDAASTRDPELVTELCNFADIISDPEAGNEWLYGRSGYLYLLRFVKVCFADDPKVKEVINDTEDEVIEAIMDTPRPWKWHGKAYVGAVHGAIGIITQIVLTDVNWAPKLEAELGALLSYQYDSGNWPSSIPPGRDRLVQVCHGAPGVIISLESIKEHFPKLKDKIERAIARGRGSIVERGLLTKEPCLCHGISGNALALDSPHFEHFLSFTTGHEIKAMDKDGLMERSDDPASLWTGEAGRAWAWAVADKGLEKRLLGYNDV